MVTAGPMRLVADLPANAANRANTANTVELICLRPIYDTLLDLYRVVFNGRPVRIVHFPVSAETRIEQSSVSGILEPLFLFGALNACGCVLLPVRGIANLDMFCFNARSFEMSKMTTLSIPLVDLPRHCELLEALCTLSVSCKVLHNRAVVYVLRFNLPKAITQTPGGCVSPCLPCGNIQFSS